MADLTAEDVLAVARAYREQGEARVDATTVDGLPTSEDEHSPQIPLPPGAPFSGIDHVVPVPGGTDKEYSAQWHPKGVVDPENPWVVEPDPPDQSGFPNLVNWDANDDYSTSSAKVETAVANEDVGLVTSPEEAVFTCPVRAHDPDGD